MIDRKLVYNKYNGRCAYSGTQLEEDWQIDHKNPKKNGGTDDIDNLMPVQRIINHYKRASGLELFRIWLLGGLHHRLKKLPKNPKTMKSKKKKEYLLDVAKYFNITADKPFCGKFYFETYIGEATK